MRRSLAALLAAGLAAGLAPAAGPAPDALVEQLGSVAFPDREAAAKELLKRGPAVLDALARAADGHPDAEVRQRAAGLVEQIKRAGDATRLVAPKKVKLDYNGVPLGTALADLRTKTGVPLTLDQHKVADPLRPVTVRTDELPAWEAIEAFCQQAGLHEVFHETVGGEDERQAPRVRRRVVYAGPHVPTETAGQVPVLLADGKAATLPGERATAVRVLALPPNFPGNRVVRGSGQVVLNLDVTPLPGVKWDDVTAVRVTRAEDETGRPLAASHRPDHRPGPFDAYGDIVWVGGMQAQVAWAGDVYNLPTPARPNPRVVPVTLKTDDRSVRSLRVFEGVVVGEVTLPNQTLAVIRDLKAAGANALGPSDTRFTVVDYKVLPNGRVSIKVRTEGPNPWTARQLGRRGGLLANNIMIWDGPTPPNNNALQFKFADAAGKPLPSPLQQGSSMSDDGVRQTAEFDLVFPKRPDVGPPATLTVVGNKPAAVEIPFRLKNVALP